MIEKPARRKHFRWDYADDLAAMTGAFDGLTFEGISQRMFGDRTEWWKISSRFCKLKLGLKDARIHARSGVKPEEYLRTSPLYGRPKEKAPEPVADTPLSSYALMPFIVAPPELKQGPAFYLHAANELERAAKNLRAKASKMLEDGMGSKKAI